MERAHKDNLRKLKDLKQAIAQAINDITPTMLRRVSRTMHNHVELCLQENGGRFQHLL